MGQRSVLWAINVSLRVWTLVEKQFFLPPEQIVSTNKGALTIIMIFFKWKALRAGCYRETAMSIRVYNCTTCECKDLEFLIWFTCIRAKYTWMVHVHEYSTYRTVSLWRWFERCWIVRNCECPRFAFLVHAAGVHIYTQVRVSSSTVHLSHTMLSFLSFKGEKLKRSVKYSSRKDWLWETDSCIRSHPVNKKKSRKSSYNRFGCGISIAPQALRTPVQ